MQSEIARIFIEYEQKKDQIEVTIEQFREDLSAYEGRIILYGAGSAGIAFLHYLRDAQILPTCFSDGDKDKHGCYVEGLKVISPEEIVKKYGKDALVIVTINTDGEHYCRDFKQALLSGGHKGVHQSLREVGCENVVDYVYFQRVFSLYRGGNYNLPACADVNLMYEHREDISKAYDLLVDEMSKKIFRGILEYRMLMANADIPTISEKKQYFEYDLFPMREDEVLVDCGACGGSSLKIFLEETNEEFEMYYGIEPDVSNYARLEQYVNSLRKETTKKIKLVNKAAYSVNNVVNFFVLNGPGTFQSVNGSDIVETETIDSIVSGNKVTYIKMNIEGSEVPALLGAEQTIREYKPRLAIMGYHKTSDFWEVPLLIHKFRADYKLKLRSYMKNIAFCYYAH